MVEQKVVQIAKPTVVLDTFSTTDYESAGDKSASTNQQSGQKGEEDKAAPSLSPLIRIKDYIFLTDEVDYMKITTADPLPEIILTVKPQSSMFASTAYPKDGDLINVFIASKSNEFKPIRIDFEINRIISPLSDDAQADSVEFTFQGRMRVPLFYAEDIIAYEDSMSYDALMKVAKKLGLGFASNETSTKDSMSWINPYMTWNEFIDDITMHSFKDLNSFYTTHVDQYYNLCFINVNQQFAGEDKIDEGLIKQLLQSRKNKGDGPENQVTSPLILTNFEGARNTNFHIEKYTILNNAGDIVKSNGYGRYLQFYSHDLKKYSKDQQVEPIYTKKKRTNPLRGRANEDIFQDIKKYKWSGIERPKPKGNYHDNYLYAPIQNIQNLQEIQKLALHIQLRHVNFNFFRYQKVPVGITIEDHPVKNTLSQNDSSEKGHQPARSDLGLDNALSGFYVIQEMSYIYINKTFQQEMMLIRREWPVQESDIAPD